jgi:hypothetical protein
MLPAIRLAENDHITIFIISLYIHDIRPIICDPYWGFPRYLTPRHVSKVEQVRDMILIRLLKLWHYSVHWDYCTIYLN